MPNLTITELFDKYDKTSKPEYMIASEVAATLDAKSVYTNFIPENEQILTKMHEIINGKTFTLPKNLKIKPNLPAEPVKIILNHIKNGDFSKISEIKNHPNFSNWYEDKTTFHPALQYIYELSLEYPTDPTQEKTKNLDNTITALASCFIDE